MAELGGLAVRRLLLLRATARASVSGIHPVKKHLSTQVQNLSASVPFYKKPWRVFVAVLLERKPVISRDFTELEEKFNAYQKSLELEKSALSNYEVKKMKLVKGSKSNKKKMTEAEEQKRLECEQELSQIEDEEEAIAEELENLQLGSRTVTDDENSLERLLSCNLHLVIKQSDKWTLPETELVAGETLKQAAERLISSEYPSDCKAFFMSNAPAGVCTEKIASSERETSENQGKKIFYYKAIIQPDSTGYPTFGSNSKWLTLEEMGKLLPKEHFKQISRFAS